EVPPRVEYSLTEDGMRLNVALQPLAAWGRERPIGGAAGEEPLGQGPSA
ncbi:winged helix-turn-helix transcriptional regulator, partial [Streptomyces sp. NPDC001635]